MRKIILPLLLLCLLAGCAPTSSPVPVPEPTIFISPNRSTLTAQDGTVLLRRTSPQIMVTMPTQAATNAVSRSLAETERQWTGDLSDWEGMIIDEYQPGEAWEPWFCDIEAQSTRLDEQVLSVYFTCHKYAGGNHPTLAVDGATYHCQTGQRLTLEDLMAEEHAPWELASLVNAALAPSRDRLYDDYEALVSKAFTEGSFPCWYLSDDGLCFAFAPYAIGSYASGIITAEIPYKELGELLRPEYL